MAELVTRLPSTLPEMSVDARTLMERLSRVDVGDLVTYDELSALIGRNVTQDARHLLRSARARLEKEEHVVFAPVIAVGVRRLDDVGVVATGEQALSHVRRTSHRAARRQSFVDLGKLDESQKKKALLYQSMFGMIAHMTRARTVRAVEAKIVAALPTAKMVDAIRATL